ncbi:unnamed protein product [Lampetra planeri]
MARLPLLPLLLLLPLLPLAACATPEPGSRLGPGVNGGFGCLGCVIAVGMVQQLSEIHNDSISSAMARLCGVLPETHNLRASCQILLQVFGPSIIWMLNTEVTPDVVCHALALCRRDPGEAFCHVFPLPRGGLHQAVEAARRLAPGSPVPDKFLELSGICSLPKIRDLCELIRRCWSHHTPAQDGDGDLFSTVPVFRGSHWRGRDCADRSADVHPGRRPSNQDAFEDSNCNGIWGVDPADGVAYEKKFCESSRPRGLVLLGDSAGAHFHIPAAWMTGELLSPEAFSNLPVALANELDWPQLSAFTGFMNSSWASITSPTDSLYLRQNLAVNGQCVSHGVEPISQSHSHCVMRCFSPRSFSRNESDHPALLVYSFIGNDVCNNARDTVAEMTTPEEMRENALAALAALDKALPPGSHVLLTGLADGRFLWDHLHGRLHPVGDDVTYADAYAFLDCLQLSPCAGWMSANASLRDATSERAQQLSLVLEKISATRSFSNFDAHYVEYPLAKMAEEWVWRGGEAWQLIEAVDGFHPDQTALALMAGILWDEITQRWPDVLGPENPHNADIARVFGDQGGH